mmetsp:Transcript_9893/g.11718  ORF Transcript_9893/g.11718 Transcript_9893/m.11718 type:complete len:136 (-) Transcript_9893:16-423(-)
MRLLNVSFMATLLVFPLLLHVPLDLLHHLVVLFFCVLSDNFLPVCVLIFDCLQFLVEFLLLALVFFVQSRLELCFRLLLLFFEALALLPNGVANAFFNCSLSIPDALLVSAQSLVLRVFQFVVRAALFSDLALPI